MARCSFVRSGTLWRLEDDEEEAQLLVRDGNVEQDDSGEAVDGMNGGVEGPATKGCLRERDSWRGARSGMMTGWRGGRDAVSADMGRNLGSGGDGVLYTNHISDPDHYPLSHPPVVSGRHTPPHTRRSIPLMAITLSNPPPHHRPHTSPTPPADVSDIITLPLIWLS